MSVESLGFSVSPQLPYVARKHYGKGMLLQANFDPRSLGDRYRLFASPRKDGTQPLIFEIVADKMETWKSPVNMGRRETWNKCKTAL